MAIKGTRKDGIEVNLLSTHDQELEVRAIVESELEHASGTGDAWVAHSANADIDAGDTILLIKNTGDNYLVFDRLIGNPANVTCRYSVNIGSATTTLAGNVITPANLNGGNQSDSPDCSVYGDETAVADGTEMFAFWVNTTDSLLLPLDGIVLAKGQYIQINQETESTSGQIDVFFHFTSEIV